MHYIGLLVFLLLVLIAFLATVLPFFPSKQWYIRIFDFPRLQTFFIALIALAWYLVFYFRDSKKAPYIAAILLIIIIIQAYKAFPYTPLAAKQVLWSEKNPSDTTQVSLFICNVLQSNTAYDKVLQKIADYNPDIVITTESNQDWQRALSPIEKEYRHMIAVPKNNTYGMHLYSRLALQEKQVRYLLEPDIPSIRAQVQLRSGQWVHIFVVHPRPPVPGEEDDSKERDAEIIMVAKEAKKETGGVIVAGDFNDVAWSKTTALFQEVSGFLDPRRGRGFYNTFHAKYPVFRWPLDHIFHSSHFKLLAIERVDDVDSDHFPMFIKLSYEPSEKYEQPKVQPEKNTDEEANKTIEEGKKEAGVKNK
jgi:endonuclease/exonuclease/phosphatase (EEP) superfamily protein YafD